MPAQPSFPWRELAETLFRRKYIALVFATVGVVLGAYGAFTSAPVYVAESTLLYEVQRSTLTLNGLERERVDRWDVGQQVELIQNAALIREALMRDGWTDERAPEPEPFTIREAIRLIPKPRLLANRIYYAIHDIEKQGPLDRYVAQTMRGLSVRSIRGTNMIELSFRSFDPEYAAHFLNNLVETHIERALSLTPQSQARDFLVEQRDRAAERLQKAEADVRAYKLRTGLGAGNLSEEGARGRINELEDQRASALIQISEQQARIAALERQMSAQPKDIVTGTSIAIDPVLAALQGELASLKVQKTQLLAKYAPGSTRMRDLDQQIEHTEAEIAAQAAADPESTTALNPAFAALESQRLSAQVQIEAIQARIASIDANIVDARSKLQSALVVSPELTRLQQNVTQAQAVYTSYLAKAEQARFAGDLDETSIFNLSVVEEARVPWAPQGGKRTQQVLISGLLWFGLGCLAAFARDFFDPTVKSASQAARCSGLPVIAEIPA